MKLPRWEPPENWEYVNGRYVELAYHSPLGAVTATTLCVALGRYAQERRLGEAFIGMPYHLPLPEDPDRCRKPSLSFVSYERWPRGRSMPDDDAWDVIPELAVEVLSPPDRRARLADLIDEYFRAGIRQVWVIRVKDRSADIFYSPDRCVRAADELDGGTVLPGFRLSLASLFPEPPANPGTP